MKNFDYTCLNWKSLRTFLIVLEEGSVTRAANRLGQTQSAISHTLDNLRCAFDDPLFVRSGRGISPTKRAMALQAPVLSIMNGIKALAHERQFDATSESMEFTLVASDFQRQLFFPDLMRQFEKEGIDVRFRFLQSDLPETSMLNDTTCDLMLTPFPPSGSNIMQAKLFKDRIVCFYDATARDAPVTRQEFRESEYVEISTTAKIDAPSSFRAFNKRKLNTPKISTPSFGDLGSFIEGTRLITTQTSAMKLGPLAGFGVSDLPFETPPLTTYLVWHQRDQADPAHRWLRGRIKERAKEVATQVFNVGH